MEQDIIEKVVDQPIPCISPIVVTRKKDGSTRICVDMSEANHAMERERHIMPMLQDFKAEVNEAKFFSKIDLKQAYHQFELHPETDSSPHSPHSKGYSSAKGFSMVRTARPKFSEMCYKKISVTLEKFRTLTTA